MELGLVAICPFFLAFCLQFHGRFVMNDPILFHAFTLKKERNFGIWNLDKYRIPTFKVRKTNVSMHYSLEFRTIRKFA